MRIKCQKLNLNFGIPNISIDPREGQVEKHSGVLEGFGLKFFPDKTKKDLRFFEA